MKKIFQLIIDFPQMVNQKVLNAKLNAVVNQFDSQDGVRFHTKSIYQILAVVVFITMELAVINGAITYFSDASHSGLAKAGSIFTTILLLYAAFPIAQIIRSRGESLGGAHNGIVTFIFKDFVTTNIKILGEVAAVGGFIGASCFTLSFLFDANLFTITNTASLSALAGLATLPMEGLTNLFLALKLEYLTSVLSSFSSFNLASTQSFTSDMLWNYNDLFLVAGSFINVLVGLAFLYVNLAIYQFLYTIVANFIKWIQSPSIPISVKNK